MRKKCWAAEAHGEAQGKEAEEARRRRPAGRARHEREETRGQAQDRRGEEDRGTQDRRRQIRGEERHGQVQDGGPEGWRRGEQGGQSAARKPAKKAAKKTTRKAKKQRGRRRRRSPRALRTDAACDGAGEPAPSLFQPRCCPDPALCSISNKRPRTETHSLRKVKA